MSETSLPESYAHDVPTRSPAPIDGTVKEFPALGKYVVGLIETEGSERISFSFHVRDLVTGGEDGLAVGEKVTFSLRSGRAINVRLIDVPTYSGVIEEYNEEGRNGIIVDSDSSQRIQMKFDDIFKKLPHKIEPGLCVSYTLGSCQFATNIRFPHLKPISGIIARFFSSENGEIKPDTYKTKVRFNIAGVRDRDRPDTGLLKPGARVTYDLERKFSRGKNQHKANAVQATNIAIQDSSLAVLEPVEHIDAAGFVPPESLRAGASTHRESSRVEATTSPMHSKDPVVRLTFSRNPKELHEVLQMLDLPGVHSDSRLSCGGYIIAPLRLHKAIEARSHELKLGPADVIVTAELEQVVMDEIKNLPRKYKISITSSSINLQAGETAFAEDAQQDVTMSEDVWNVQVKRTFIHLDLSSSLRSEPSPHPQAMCTFYSTPAAAHTHTSRDAQAY